MNEVLKKLLVNHNFISDDQVDSVLELLDLSASICRGFRKLIATVDKRFDLKNEKRFPVILIIDENLDKFPWESMNYLLNFECTRISSLHFLYFLYKQHQSSISNG